MADDREPEPVQVFFDYTCPFTYRAQRWLEALGEVRLWWRPFSLLERNYRGDGPSVWRLPERAEDISLLLFAGHELVRAGGGDLDRYRKAVFAASGAIRGPGARSTPAPAAGEVSAAR